MLLFPCHYFLYSVKSMTINSIESDHSSNENRYESSNVAYIPHNISQTITSAIIMAKNLFILKTTKPSKV